MQSDMQPDAYNIGVNDGAAAGQTIPHLHVHSISRNADDNPDLCGSVRQLSQKKAKYWT
jgi:diadenosine tetraphosphate (Ap4A) HIT family hydrolase